MSSKRKNRKTDQAEQRKNSVVHFFKLMSRRVFWVWFAIAIQLIVILLVPIYFRVASVIIGDVCSVLTIIMAIVVINQKTNASYRLAWLFLMMLVPLFGWLLYLLFGGRRLTLRDRKFINETKETRFEARLDSIPPSALQERLGENSANVAKYLDALSSPAYERTKVEYYPLGDIQFQRMLQCLHTAKKYIFVEYFIIAPGKMWDSILEILEEKVLQGVEVRVLYDDMGCINTLPHNYRRTLENKGIKCGVFNKFRPVISVRANNRSHQKMLIVDGKMAFTGGINLADEYINEKVRFGHWKDAGILVEGEAAWGMTVMFFNMWNFATRDKEDFSIYRPDDMTPDGISCVQPYADSPLDAEAIGATVYSKLINQARNYLYLTTPYLIIDGPTTESLTAMAKSGVDVRIITPHIPDKKIVFEVTRAHYDALIKGGVKIYEYTPGFIHSKIFAVDDRLGTVGTVNMDYRSLYLHYENGVVVYDPNIVEKIRDDFLDTQSKSQQITEEMCRRVPIYQRAFRAILRIFAPLM